jgi:hypothetical protein
LNPLILKLSVSTIPRRQSLNTLTFIQVADTFINLTDHFKLLGVTLDSHLSFDNHVSNVCSSSYFYVHALRHIRPFLDIETSKTIACAIVGSKLDYPNSVLTGISSHNIHRLQRSKFTGLSRHRFNIKFCIFSHFTSLASYSAAH